MHTLSAYSSRIPAGHVSDAYMSSVSFCLFSSFFPYTDDGGMQLRHAVYIYVMGIHHRYATVTYKWTYGVDMHAVYAQKDGASAYKWSPFLHTNQFCIQMEPSDGLSSTKWPMAAW